MYSMLKLWITFSYRTIGFARRMICQITLKWFFGAEISLDFYYGATLTISMNRNIDRLAFMAVKRSFVASVTLAHFMSETNMMKIIIRSVS